MSKIDEMLEAFRGSAVFLQIYDEEYERNPIDPENITGVLQLGLAALSSKPVIIFTKTENIPSNYRKMATAIIPYDPNDMPAALDKLKDKLVELAITDVDEADSFFAFGSGKL